MVIGSQQEVGRERHGRDAIQKLGHIWVGQDASDHSIVHKKF